MSTVITLHCHAQGQDLDSSSAQPGWGICTPQGQQLGDPKALLCSGRVDFLPQSHTEDPLALGMQRS